MPVLNLRGNNERKEIEFELKYLASLSTKERFTMMIKKTEEMVTLLKKSGHRKTAAIIKIRGVNGTLKSLCSEH